MNDVVTTTLGGGPVKITIQLNVPITHGDDVLTELELTEPSAEGQRRHGTHDHDDLRMHRVAALGHQTTARARSAPDWGQGGRADGGRVPRDWRETLAWLAYNFHWAPSELKRLSTWELRWWAERCQYLAAELRRNRD